MENQTENFVIDEHDVRNSEPEGGISVLPHLIIVGVVLALVFGSIIIPKTLSYFTSPLISNGQDSIPKPAEPVPVVKIDQTIDLIAKAAHVLDITTGETLYEKNAETVLPLASITKVMAALVAYELVPEDTPITISREAALQYGGGVTWGEQFQMKELSDFALVTSLNSASYGLAAAVGELLGEQDPTAQFIAAMNIKAEELGLSSLRFLNPTGLDVSVSEAGAYGSAADISKLMAYTLETYPEVIAPSTAPTLLLYNSDGAYHRGENTNDSLRAIPNLLGSKTGYTDLAGGNLTIVFNAGHNRPIAITVLGSTLMGRFSDVESLAAAVLETVSE